MTHDHHDDHEHLEDTDCLEAMDSLYAYLDGELTEPEAIARYEQHLSHCRSCFSRHEFEVELTSRIRKSKKGAVPDSVRSRLHNLMDKF